MIPLLRLKIPNELILTISHRFNDFDCWDVIEVLKVFKEDLIAREKLFSLTLNADLFIDSSLLAGTEKFKKKANFLILFCNESHKSQSYKGVPHIETTLYARFSIRN